MQYIARTSISAEQGQLIQSSACVCAYLRIIVFVGEDKAGLAAPGNEAEVVLASIAEAPGVVAHIRL
jgi:hypothetical protein